ncbi:MAG: DUF4912 domain-containing protein [Spirochaetaceae bacterium]|nr:MAG: DUF4912 domain-containing protein [Spirochaetaceae bacterium]
MYLPSLSDASYEALLRLADTYGVDVPESATRAELEEMVEDALEEWRQEQGDRASSTVRVEESKFGSPAQAQPSDAQVSTELPDRYNETRVVLMLRDPSWAFAYWDLSDGDRSALGGADGFEALLLQVHSMDDDSEDVSGSSDHYEIPISLLDNRWYLNLPDQDRLYRLALVARVDSVDSVLAVSNLIAVPRGTVADDPADDGTAVSSQSVDEIIAQTGIRDFDVMVTGKPVPQRILDLVDEELLFH